MILLCKNGPVEINESTLHALKKVYATKDIDLELSKMHLWLLRHPKQRPTFIWTFMKNWLKKAPDVIPPAMPVNAGWWKSEPATLEIARDLGLEPRPGEELNQFRERISRAITEQRDRNNQRWLPKVRAALETPRKS